MSTTINKTSNSIKWTSINTVFNSVVQPFYRLGLALLLSPTDYGYLSIILLIVSLAELLNNMGVGEVLIKEADISYKETSTLFYFNLILSILFTSIFILSAESIALFYGYPQLENYIKVLAVVVLLNGSTSIFKFYLHKYFHFKIASILLIIRFSLEILLTLIFLIIGMGLSGVVLSLIISYMIYSLGLTYFSTIRHGFKIRLYFSTIIIKRFLSNGLFISFQRILNFSSNKIDEIFVGKLFGPTVLGQYYLAKSILFQIQSLLSRSFGQVMLPLFSKIKDDINLIKKTYMQIINILLLIGAPIFLVIYFFADNFILVLFGHEWFESIFVFQLLAIPTLLMFLNAGITNTIMIAINRIKYILLIEITTTTIFIISVFILELNSLNILILLYSGYIYAKVFISKLILWFSLNTTYLYLIKSLGSNLISLGILSVVFYTLDIYTKNYTFYELIFILIFVIITWFIINIFFNKSQILYTINILKKIIIS